jgi:hypothetical protein
LPSLLAAPNGRAMVSRKVEEVCPQNNPLLIRTWVTLRL